MNKLTHGDEQKPAYPMLDKKMKREDFIDVILFDPEIDRIRE
jgi:hypothetical protein